MILYEIEHEVWNVGILGKAISLVLFLGFA